MYQDRLRAVIAERRVRQCQIAKGTGMNPALLNRKLHGHVEFKVPELKAVCDYLGIKMDDLEE